MRTGIYYNLVANKLLLVKKLDVEFKYGTLYALRTSKYEVEVMTQWKAEKQLKPCKYIGRF